MMKKIFYLIVLVLGVKLVNAQDIIIKRDSSIIKAKITAVEKKSVEYKKSNYKEGPSFEIRNKKISKIIYANGDTANFKKSVFHNASVFSERKGFYVGFAYAPSLSTQFSENSELYFMGYSQFSLKYYFNNKIGLKSGINYFYSESDETFNNDEAFINPVYNLNTKSAIGIPLHIVYNSLKRFGFNVELGGSYYYPFQSDAEQSKFDIKRNFIFTTDAKLGLTYRLSSRIDLNTGIMAQYDIINFTDRRNSNNFISGVQFGCSYKIGEF